MRRVKESKNEGVGGYRLPVFGTVRHAWEIFKREWWRLMLLAAIPEGILWLVAVLPIPAYPKIPSFLLLFHSTEVFAKRFLVALPFDLLWVLLYSWLDCGKTRIVRGAATGMKRKLKLRKALKVPRKVLGRMILVRIAVGTTQRIVSALKSFAWFSFALPLRLFLNAGLFLATLSLGTLLILMPFKIVVEKRGFFESIRQSYKRVEPYFWRVFAIVLLVGLPYVVFVEACYVLRWNLPLQSETSLPLFDYLLDALLSLVEIACFSFGWAALGAIYARLRGRRPKRLEPLVPVQKTARQPKVLH
ncbi:hypothetical protein ES703_16222 [subsurface metagenome]|nr:hypothetical protein [bacterium]